MKIGLIIICLIALAVVYKVSSNPSGNHDGAGIEGGTIQSKGPDTYSLSTISSSEEIEKEWETSDTSGENFTALEYVQKYVGHYCGQDTGWMLSCKFKNRGDRNISTITVEIRGSSHILDPTDMKKNQYEQYKLELIGPFPASQTSYGKAKLPTEDDIQWLSSQSTILSAEY